MQYPEFKSRYNILAAKLVAKAKNDKAAAGAVMDVVKLDKEKFRLGHTKVSPVQYFHKKIVHIWSSSGLLQGRCRRLDGGAA